MTRMLILCSRNAHDPECARSTGAVGPGWDAISAKRRASELWNIKNVRKRKPIGPPYDGGNEQPNLGGTIYVGDARCTQW